MQYSTLVVAAFLALASGINGAPIDARTTKPKTYKAPGIAVIGSGNGGSKSQYCIAPTGVAYSSLDGGSNFAVPIAISDASTKAGSVKWGQISTGSWAENQVGQNANGGAGSAVGSYGSDNHFAARGRILPPINVAPNVDPTVVVLSGNGGCKFSLP